MIYKHKNWFKNENKTVEEAMEYFAKSKDFVLRLKQNVRLADVGLPNGCYSNTEVVKYCVENINTHWKFLKIAYTKGGSDAGKLKIKTFIEKGGYNVK